MAQTSSSSSLRVSSQGASNLQLDKWAHQVPSLSSHYHGAVAKDQMPNFKKGDGCCIVNLEKSSQAGTHWISCGNRNGQGWYYDSFGLDIPPLIAASLPRPIAHVRKEIQATASVDCGLYALGACIAMYTNSKRNPGAVLYAYDQQFSRPILDDNDNVLKSYLKRFI